LRNAVVVGVLLLVIGIWWLYKIMEKRKSIKLEQKFFIVDSIKNIKIILNPNLFIKPMPNLQFIIQKIKNQK
jgi:hypothetical protein